MAAAAVGGQERCVLTAEEGVVDASALKEHGRLGELLGEHERRVARVGPPEVVREALDLDLVVEAGLARHCASADGVGRREGAGMRAHNSRPPRRSRQPHWQSK